MNAKDVLRTAMKMDQTVLESLLGDLSDADLLVRPVPGANCIAWQLGHVIESEKQLLEAYLPAAKYPALPAGWSEQHSKAAAASDSTKGYYRKEEYLNWYRRMREATLRGLDALPDAELDKPTTGDLASFAPTVGAMVSLAASHMLMHSGQFSVVRRKLGKAVAF